jgi:uncharacterized protein YfaS (alpha-2-macroglobulin family)
MNTLDPQHSHPALFTAQRVRRLSILLVLVTLIVAGLACGKSSPTPTAEKTRPPEPTNTRKIEATATSSKPIDTPTAVPTPTEIVGLKTIVDDGSPLAPQILSQQPANGQEIPLDGAIEIIFDQPMDQNSTSAALQVVNPEGKSLSGEVTWPSATTLRFKPAQKLAAGSVYMARLNTKAASAKGVALRDDITFEFNAVGELQISQVFPADLSKDVEGKSAITVIFNRPVVPLVIAEEQANLPSPIVIDPAVEGNGEWINTSVYLFRPAKTLKGSTTYHVAVLAGLADAAGLSTLAADYTWQFSTVAPSIENFWLNGDNYWGYNPADYYANVPLEQGFSIKFRQEMDRASVEAALWIQSESQEAVPLSFVWNDASTQVVFTPTQLLALGSNYLMHLGQEALSSDGGTLQEGLDWHFYTVLPPAIQYTSPGNGSTQETFDGLLQIFFASPMEFKTLKDKVVISPEPKDKVDWYYSEDDYYAVWSIYAYCLEPSTRYTVRIPPGMADKYGNQITDEYVFSFKTGPRYPWANLQMPYGPALYRVGGPQSFYANYGNARNLTFGVYHLTSEKFVAFQNYTEPQEQYLPPRQDLVWSVTESGQGALNLSVLKEFTPTMQSGSPLEPGFYFLTLDTPSVDHKTPFVDTRRLIVTTANLTIKYTQSEVLVWLTDLTSGKPLGGISITIYDGNFKPIAQGVTDEHGLLYAPNITTNTSYYYSLYAMTDEGQSTFAFAASDWGSGVTPYDFGVWEEYYSYTNQPKAYVYTERPLYRPDQPVYFKGIVRIDDDLAYSIPIENQVKVTIQSYEETVYESTMPLSSLGTFNGEFLLDKEAALGYYTINVTFPGKDEVIGSVGFSVAEYHTPEFLVEVTSEQKDVVGGENFTATVSAEYYSGGGLVNADVYWTLAATSFYFAPPEGKYSNYSFNEYERDLYYFMDNSGSYNEIVAEGNATTDEFGKIVLTLPTDLSKYKTGATFTLEVSVTDLSGNTVSGRTSVVGHRSTVYPGLKPDVYVGTEGKPLTVLSVALDWEGNPIPGQAMSVEIVERRWHSVQEEDENGNLRWTSSVEEIPVTRFDNVVMGSEGNGSVSFIPPNGGVFMARAIALDSGGREGRATVYMWVAGKDYIPWRQENNRTFELVLDREQYNPGEEAQILIASPFQGEVYALVTIERGHIRQREVLQLTSNSTVYNLPITADMAPGVYVSVLIVKGVDDTNPRPDFRMSIAKLKVSTKEQQVQVSVVPDREQAGPGEAVNYTIHTTDVNGQPVDAEVSLGLSDLAVLSLMASNSAPIQDFFYSERGLSVWTSVPIVNSIEYYNAELAARQEAKNANEGRGGGSGGGKGGDEFGVMQIREKFLDTAYWNASVETVGGEATVSITLPDNLTTWRMDARAVTGDTRVGQTTTDIISTRPLLVRPQTPRFFVVGDEAQLGAAVHNNTDQPLSVQVTLQAVGVNLQSDATQVVDIPAHRQAYVTWNVSVRIDVTRVDLVFSAVGGDYADASRPPLGTLDNQGIPVYSYEAPETVGTSGQMLEGGTQIEAINLPSAFTVSAGTLTIEVAPSLAAGMTEGLSYLEHYPYECIEQTISRFLPNVLTIRALRTAGISDPELEAKIQEQLDVALQRLYNWQNADGGWGWWGNQESEPLTSSYVVLGLALTRDAGYGINDDVLSRGLGYIRSQLRSTKSFTQPYLLNRQAFLLYVLARAGEPDVSSTVKLYDFRQDMAIYTRAMLAHTLYIIDAKDTRIQTLLSDFNTAAILSATGTHWEEAAVDYWNWNTDTRTTAIVLSALSYIDPTNPLNANAVRWLMSSRTGGHWRGTQETAWTLMALTNWMEVSGELQANYQYAVALNGERIGGGVANAETLRETLTLQVDVSQLLQGEANRLAFARDEGAGNLYYTAHLKVNLPVEQTQALDRGIVVSRTYYYPDDPNTPVTQVKQGDLVLVRVTIVAPNALHYVMVDDPLPAGMEAVDQSLNTSPQNITPMTYSWEDMYYKGWGWWWFDHVELRDERVTLSADYLPAGTYLYTYLARASTPGTFRVIPTTAQEFYFPEVYGRGDGSLFIVNP